MARIGDYIQNNSFWPDVEHVTLPDLAGKYLRIEEVKAFQNDKGPGVALRFRIITEDGKTGDDLRTVTHSKAIVDIFNNADVLALMENGEVMEGTVVRRKSAATGQLYYTME